MKVSGGTQTDLKSYSVGSTSGAHLSASVRERLMQGSQSLPKTRADTGSLSDSNYTELSPYSAMYRHTTAYTASLPARATAGVPVFCEQLPFFLQYSLRVMCFSLILQHSFSITFVSRYVCKVDRKCCSLSWPYRGGQYRVAASTAAPPSQPDTHSTDGTLLPLAICQQPPQPQQQH